MCGPFKNGDSNFGHDAVVLGTPGLSEIQGIIDTGLLSQGLNEIQGICQTQKRALNEKWMDNIAGIVLARPHAEVEGEKEVLDELDKKYDHMKVSLYDIHCTMYNALIVQCICIYIYIRGGKRKLIISLRIVGSKNIALYHC